MNSLLQANLDAAQARIQEPKTGADLGERPTEAVRLRTAGQQNQCFEQRCLKHQPTAQATERVQRRSTTPAQAGNERNAELQIAEHDGSIHHQQARSTGARTSLASRPPADGRPA